MKILSLIPLLLCLIVVFSPVSAQESTDSGWPVEERCVGEATQPPDGWTFPGAILMTGHYGIHAVSADMPTPYVVAFLRWNTLEGVRREQAPNNNILSPDKKWAVFLEGGYINTNRYTNAPYATGLIFITGIRVYSTGIIRETHFLPWDSSIDYRGALHPTPLPEPLWIDNQTFALEGKLANPFTGEISDTDNYYYRNVQGWDEGDYPSPNWTRHVTINDGVSWWRASAWVSDIQQDKTISSSLELITGTVTEWLPDSSGFAAEIPANGQADSDELLPPRLALFDQNGDQTDIIFDAQTIGKNGRLWSAKRWNENGSHLAFLAYTQDDQTFRNLHLYVADMSAHVVINTCLQVDESMAWSSDNELLALLSPSGSDRDVHILDMKSWKLFIVSRHHLDYASDGILGWRGDE